MQVQQLKMCSKSASEKYSWLFIQYFKMEWKTSTFRSYLVFKCFIYFSFIRILLSVKFFLFQSLFYVTTAPQWAAFVTSFQVFLEVCDITFRWSQTRWTFRSRQLFLFCRSALTIPARFPEIRSAVLGFTSALLNASCSCRGFWFLRDYFSCRKTPRQPNTTKGLKLATLTIRAGFGFPFAIRLQFRAQTANRGFKLFGLGLTVEIE